MADYHVDPINGSDARSGLSFADSWRTATKASNTVVAGDTVTLYGGNFDESFTIKRSGTVNAPIIWIAASGETPTIRGQAGIQYIVDNNGFSYNIFDGVDFTWHPASPVANKRFPWIKIRGAAAVGNEFRNCTIYRDGAIADIYAAGWDDWGIQITNAQHTHIYRCTVYGQGQPIILATGADQYTLIEECTCGPSVQSTIVINTSRSVLRHAWIKNCTLQGSYQEDGLQFTNDFQAANPATDISNWGTLVSGCIIKDNSENALDLKACRYVVLEHNIIYGTLGSNDGLIAPNRNSFNAVTQGANTTHEQVILRYNIFFDNGGGINLEDTEFHIYNNTAVGNNRDYTGNPSTLGTPADKLLFTGLRHSGGPGNGAVKNNIFVGMDDGPLGLVPAAGDIDIDYNYYDDEPYISAAGVWTQAASFAAWKAALDYSGGNDAHSILGTFADIDFINVPTARPTGAHTAYDFGILATSDCKGVGGPLTTVAAGATNSLTFRVKDAGYFFDGMGIVDGDTITVNGQTRTITSIDYGTDEITVSEPLTVTPGQNVYEGSSATPDIGAGSFTQGSDTGGGGSGTAGTGAVVVTRVACNTSTGNQTITFPTALSAAPKAVRFILSSAVTDGTAAAHAIMSMGFATATASYAIGWVSQDAVNPSNANRRTLENACVLSLSSTGTIDGQASWVSWTASEVVINWTNAPGSAFLLTVIAYDCAEAYLATFNFPQTLNATTTISPGFEFDLAYFATHERDIPNNRADARGSIGVATYDGSTLTQSGWFFLYQDNVTTTVDAAHLSDLYIVGNMTTSGVLQRALQLSTSGNDVIVTTKIASWADADNEGIALFLRFDNIAVYSGIVETVTSAVENTYGDPNFQPSYTEVVATLAEAVNTAYADGKAGSWSIGVADTGIRQYSNAYSDKDGVVTPSTSDTQSLSDDMLVNLPLDTGAAGIQAELLSFQPSGPKLDFTIALATIKQWILVAVEQPTGRLAGVGEGYGEAVGVMTVIINLAGVGEGDGEAIAGLTVGLTIVDLAGVGEGYAEAFGELTTTTPTLISVIRPTRTYNDSGGLSVHVHEPLIAGSGFVMDISDQVSEYQHEIEALGGYWTASIKIADRQGRLEDWFERGLSRRIVTYNPDGDTAWEGFVNRITLNLGGLTKSIGPVLNIANKVKLIYSFIDSEATSPVIGLRASTAWAQDTNSQAKWGVLERVLSSGGATPTTATSLRDDYLRENAQPESDEDQNIGSSLSEPQITLECLGYVHYLQTYSYNSTTTGTTSLSAKLAAVLAAEPNTFLSHSNKFIEANALLVAAFDNDNRVAWNVVKELVSKGDDSDNRYLFGVYADQMPHYAPVVDQVDYLQYLSDPAQTVTTSTGVRVPPWDVKPGKWIFSPDFLIGRVPQNAALRDDLRMEFIESVTYRAPWDLAIRGGKVRRLDQKLAKLGLAGIGG